MILLGTGLSGLVGSRVVELLPTHIFEDISRKTGTDIVNPQAVFDRIHASSSKVILHMAAYTNVDQAEIDKPQDKESNAWKINVEGTKNVLEAAEKTGKKVIYISTDMVFPGDKELPGKYTENEEKGPVNWYARTKYEAEKLVMQSASPWVILRIAYPYRAHFVKNDSLRIFLSKLQNNEPVRAVTDHYFTPTFIDDLAKIIDFFVQENVTGIFHAGGAQTMSPYEIAQKVAHTFGLDTSLISQITREKFFQGKAQRPFNLSLNNDKIKSLGLKLSSFDEGLEAVKNQL